MPRQTEHSSNISGKIMKLSADFENKKSISDKLYGIFFEDINFSVDGGVNLNQIANKNFSAYCHDFKKDVHYYYYRIFHALRRKMTRIMKDVPLHSWRFYGEGKCVAETENGLNVNNPNSAKVSLNGAFTLENLGYNGGDSSETFGRYRRRNSHKGAVGVKQGGEYEFNAYIKNVDFSGAVTAAVVSDNGEALTEEFGIIVPSSEWEKTTAFVKATKTGVGRLVIRFNGKGSLNLTEVFFGSTEYWNRESGKYRFGKFRRDLIEALKELNPRFVRFPGGCLVEGNCLKNSYDWKATVGRLEERKTEYNLWGEAQRDRVYMQSNEIGFYEYFLLCEDLGAEPMPILNAGLACQGRCSESVTLGDAEYERRKQNVLDLVAFANGDPEKNEWAKLRADMGHPEPFGLKILGIGNENWGERYNENFDDMLKALRREYPEIKVVWSAGFDCYKHAGYEERRQPFDKMRYENVYCDDHFYRKPAWLIENEALYDDYDRARYPIFLGEYAANTPENRRVMPNEFRSALAEAAFMTGLERNADIVRLSSYAPLFSRTGGEQWKHNLINFNSLYVLKTANYYVQKLFSENVGNEYVPVRTEDGDGVFVSLTTDGKRLYLKAVNTTNEEKVMECDGLLKNATAYRLKADPTDRNAISFSGKPVESVRPEKVKVSNDSFSLLPFSVNVIVFDAE